MTALDNIRIMKAVTIWQPWASLLVTGKKIYETRSWATNYSGSIAIHAAMRSVRKTVDALASDRTGPGWATLDYLDALFMRPGALDQLPTGAVIGKALLVRCNLITEEFVKHLTPQELALGDFTLGWFAWEFEQMVQLPVPIPARGAQGLWNWRAA